MNRCSGKVRYGTWGRTRPCNVSAKIERDGRQYCTIHDPEYVARKGKAAEEKHAAAYKAAKAAREAAAQCQADLERDAARWRHIRQATPADGQPFVWVPQVSSRVGEDLFIWRLEQADAIVDTAMAQEAEQK